MMRRAVPLLLLLLLAGAANAGPPAPDRLRVPVREAGFVRVPREDLALLAGTGPLAVTRQGRPVPFTGSRADGVVFLAHDVAGPHTAWAVYEVQVDADPAEPAAGPAPADAPPPQPRPAPRPLPAVRTWNADVVHGPLAGGRPEVYAPPRAPTWFLASILPGRSLELTLDGRGAAPGAPQQLRAEVWATHVGEVALDATWNGRHLGVARGPTAAGGATFVWTVPPEALGVGPVSLEIRDVSPPLPPPPPQDVSDGRGTLWVDALALAGNVRPRVGEDLATFEVPAGVPLAFEVPPDAAPVHAAFVREDGVPGPTPRLWRDEAGGVVVAPLAASGRLFLQAGARTATVRPAALPPPPLETAGDAPHLILAVPDLLVPARRLAAHRTAAGLPSAVVPLGDVYAHHAGGEHDPRAIGAFLRERMARTAPLDFVVLAGDATLDRTDMRREPVLPTPMARTLYNGATSADRLYVRPARGPAVGGPSIGRLPFDDAASMDAWVDRLVRYETSPPAHPTRRLMRFITSEGRFGPFIDGLLERMFQLVVTEDVPPAYDIEVTFAAPQSTRLWPPPELGRKVIDGFNEGCLFYTYVGHGFAEGFDTLRVGGRRYRILHVDDVDRVSCRNTPPATFVFACTTAIFDAPGVEGIGERLLANPDGPIAYWGATRICHPAANAMLGRALARAMAEDEGSRRLGEILDVARDRVLDPGPGGSGQTLLRMAANALSRGADADRLNLEASWMYVLLGDPATKVAFPRNDVTVEAAREDDGTVVATIQAPLPDGTRVFASLETARNRPPHAPDPVEDPSDPAAFPVVRRNHARVNDLALSRVEVVLEGGRAEVRFPPRPDAPPGRRVVKAWAVAAGDVHQGAAVIEE